MPKVRAVIPNKIKLYCICEYCDARSVWPENKATKFCSEKCRRAAQYQKTKDQ